MAGDTYVTDLSEGTLVDATFAVQRKQRRHTRNGDPFLSMELADRTGRVPSLFRHRNALAAREIIRRKRPRFAMQRRERTGENQFAATLAGPRPQIEHMIGRANDRLFMLDDEKRVAVVAQIVHHAHEPAHVPRMQSDAGLVHHEKRVNE